MGRRRREDSRSRKILVLCLIIVLGIAYLYTSCKKEFTNINFSIAELISWEDINCSWTLDLPESNGNAYTVVNDNIPKFTDDEITTISFESYSELDYLGRCGTAMACIGKDIVPNEDRGDISSIIPSGWQSIKADDVEGGWLYNRCHLIAYCLTGENANEKNLITGTCYMNVEGMLPFEEMILDYVKETENHVMYRVTPVYKGFDLVASGVTMEGYSVEDKGEGISFNVYCYNIQDGYDIDYASGKIKNK